MTYCVPYRAYSAPLSQAIRGAISEFKQHYARNIPADVCARRAHRQASKGRITQRLGRCAERIGAAGSPSTHQKKHHPTR